MSIERLQMIDFKRLYRLIRDWKKIEFITEIEFKKSIAVNYDSVHNQITIDKKYIDALLKDYESNSSFLQANLPKHFSSDFIVFDFGGGIGKGFYELDSSFQKRCRAWQVIEKSHLIKKIPIDLLHSSIDFAEKVEILDGFSSCLKIGYSNSGIQYSGRMENVVLELSKLGVEMMVFERIPLITSNANTVLYVRQKSLLRSNYGNKFSVFGPRVSYNFELFGKNRFIAYLMDLGFSVSFEETSTDVFSNLKHRIGLFNIVAKKMNRETITVLDKK